MLDFLSLFNSAQRKHFFVKKYLLKNYGGIIEEFKQKPLVFQTPTGGAYPVWVCWWQGEEKMPPLVKSCYASLQKYAAGHPITLITQKNFREYTELPDYILEKLEQGKITLTHLSDILRMNLLRRYGGLWLDATILLTAPLPDFNAPLFSIKRRPSGQNVSRGRWAAYLWQMSRGNLLAEFLDTIFLEYWGKENDLVAYFLIDYCIALAYENIPVIREMLDNIPRNNPQIYTLGKLLDKPYDALAFRKICADTYFHKLSWKKDFTHLGKNGGQTFYGFLTSTI